MIWHTGEGEKCSQVLRKPKGYPDMKLIFKEEIILQQPTLDVLLLLLGKIHNLQKLFQDKEM